MFNKWNPHILKARNAKLRFERRAKKLIEFIHKVRRSVWVRRIFKTVIWLLRLGWIILRKITWPLWSPFALSKYILVIAWAFIWGKKSRLACARIIEQAKQRELKRQRMAQNKPTWRRWFGLLLLIYVIKGVLFKILYGFISPWTFCVFLLRRLWDAKKYVDECREDKREAEKNRRRFQLDEQKERERLEQKKEADAKIQRARENQLADVLRALEDF